MTQNNAPELDPGEVGDEDELIRSKGQIDGATSLDQAAAMARAFADHLQALHDAGHVLRHPVEDDYAFYHGPA